MRKPVSVLLIISFVLLIIFMTYVPLYWFSVLYSIHDFEAFQQFVLNQFSGGYLLNEINDHFLHRSHFESIQRYLIIWLILFLMVLIVIGVTFFLLIKAVFQYRISDENDFVLTKPQLVGLLALITCWFGYKLFLYNYFPLHVDEVFDFIYFSKNSLITRHTYQFTDGAVWYNNHVLYTDFSNLFLKLGFSNELSIRLPSVICELILFLIVIKTSSKKHFLEGGLTAVIVLLSFWSSIYSIQGRSYMMISLFCMMSFVAFSDYHTKRNPLSLLILILSITLGFASSKLFVLPCAGFVVYALFRINSFYIKECWFLILVIINSGLLVLVFYFPVLMISGVDSFIPKGDGRAYKDLVDQFPALLEGISVVTNVNYKAYLTLAIVPIFFLFFHKKFSKRTLDVYLFFGLQLLVLFAYIVTTKMYLPFRSMIYLNVVFSMLLAYTIYDMLKNNMKWKKTIVLVSIILMASNTFFNFKYSWLKKCGEFIYDISFYEKLDNDLNDIDNHFPKRILIHEGHHYSLFYSLLRHEKITQPYDTLPRLTPGDIIIAVNSIPKTETLKHSSVNEGIILKR